MIRILLLLSTITFAQSAAFDDTFTGRTLRLDYYHSGTFDEEHVSLDQVRLEGPWPGSRVQLLDRTNRGKYLFELYDAASGELLYSRGFASIYGEYETTSPAHDGIWGTFHESQRFPEPKAPVRLVLNKRQADGTFAPFYETGVDPTSRFVNRSEVAPAGKVWTVFEGGPPETSVDILFLGDGYTKRERLKFKRDVERLAAALFSFEPFKSRKGDFNVRAIHLPTAESGISNPRQGVWRDNPLGLSYNSLDSDRYILTYANRTVREVAAQAPYDALIIINNDRKYGGGGIFNLYATAAAHSSQAPYLVVHEFGHSFAGLADEYYTSSTAYEDFNPPGVEPWESNITALMDPANLKWGHLVETETPLPTPWNQAAYDSASYAYQARRTALREQGATEEALEALFGEVKAITKPMLEGEAHFGKVGAFEGAGYEAKGLFRPQVDCLMFTRNPDHFCRVCSEAIEQVIDMYTE